MTNLAIFYTTFGNIQDAKRIAQELVKEKYAACANIFTNMISIYDWQNELCEDSECAVIFKTDKAKSKVFSQELNKLHPYDAPCIVQLSVTDCNKAFSDWVRGEVI